MAGTFIVGLECVVISDLTCCLPSSGSRVLLEGTVLFIGITGATCQLSPTEGAWSAGFDLCTMIS